MPAPGSVLDAVPGVVARVSKRLKARVSGMIARAVLTAVSESSKMRSVQFEVYKDEGEEAEHWEAYGWTSRAKDGAEVLVLSIGASRDHRAAVVVADRRYRPTDLEEGEVCVHDDQGAEVRLMRAKVRVRPKDGGDVEIGRNTLKDSARKTDAVQAVIPAGTVVISVSGGSGAPAVGTLNPEDIILDGQITEGSGTVKVSD